MVKLLNSYFAVMAVFRGEHHLDRAIDACLVIKNEIFNLAPFSEKVTYNPNVSIGINCGELVSGNIGSESLKRLDYTVIGDVVNTAQRFESAAKPGQIVISEASYKKVKDSFKCNRVGEVKLKNKSRSIVIYEVVE